MDGIILEFFSMKMNSIRYTRSTHTHTHALFNSAFDVQCPVAALHLTHSHTNVRPCTVLFPSPIAHCGASEYGMRCIHPYSLNNERIKGIENEELTHRLCMFRGQIRTMA